MKRAVAVLMALSVVAVFAATSQARTPPGMLPSQRPDVELTFTKWFSPAFPNMMGVVGGDIPGKLGGAVLQVTPPDFSGRYLQITSVYIVVASDPAKSFTARIEGTQDNTAGTAVLNGHVIDGWLRGRHVHVEFTVIKCSEAPNGQCFQGTITVKRGGWGH
jgi:hypothetical protein